MWSLQHKRYLIFLITSWVKVIQNRMISVSPSISQSNPLSLKILVTTEPIRFYSLVNILTGIVVVLGYLLEGWDTPNPPPLKIKKILPKFFLGS